MEATEGCTVGSSPDRRKSSSPSPPAASFENLPYDVLWRIAAPFDRPILWAASLACRSWAEALRPLRKAFLLIQEGNGFKYAVCNRERALECFLEGARLGSARATVEAGVMCWEMGKNAEAMDLYRKAAQLKHPAAQCYLAFCYLEADQPNIEEAAKLFDRAARAGLTTEKFSYAVSVHRSFKMKAHIVNAAKRFLNAAQGRNELQMHRFRISRGGGENLAFRTEYERHRFKRAVDGANIKEIFEQGLDLFHSGDLYHASLYLQVATLGGELRAPSSRDKALRGLKSQGFTAGYMDNWRVQTPYATLI